MRAGFDYGMGCASIAGMKWYVALSSLAVTLCLQACTSSIDVDKAKLKARPVGCVVGRIFECFCSDGSASQQRCNAFGRYDPCACPNDANASAGTSG
jgi:hypothetical protein